MLSDSRYLAMVRRATMMPCLPRISVIWLSDSGFLAFSSATNCLISARIAVAEASPPASVATWLPKKYFSSNTPRGGEHVFGGGDARNGGFVQFELIGNLAQHQRAHRNLTVFKKVTLAVNNRLANAQNG